MTEPFAVACPRCAGTGEVVGLFNGELGRKKIPPYYVCPRCQGSGVITTAYQHPAKLPQEDA